MRRRFSSRSLTGIRLCEVAVGTARLASMFSTILSAAPRIGTVSARSSCPPASTTPSGLPAWGPRSAGGSDSSSFWEPAIRAYQLDADVTTAIAFVNPDSVDVGFESAAKWRGQKKARAHRDCFINHDRRAGPANLYGRRFCLKRLAAGRFPFNHQREIHRHARAARAPGICRAWPALILHARRSSNKRRREEERARNSLAEVRVVVSDLRTRVVS